MGRGSAPRPAPPLAPDPRGGFLMAIALEKLGLSESIEAARGIGPVGFIGAGRVGTALASLLHARGVTVAGVSGRTLTDGRRMAGAAGLGRSASRGRGETLAASSLVFLTVPDDEVGSLCAEIAAGGGWREGQGVVHCSGALPSSVLAPARDMGARVASFHPLQAFATVEAAIAHMPGSAFGIEGDPELVRQLSVLASLLGGTPLQLTPEEKAIYHAAAVIASNYTVTLAALASQLLASEGIAPDLNMALRYLLPLLRGTVDNLDALGLPDALTGPIARGDAGTVARHLTDLDRCAPEVAHLYRHLAGMTLPLALEKGGLTKTEAEEIKEVINPQLKEEP
jgi:predicted short-subunit dehydrogenase-like oxidoreductase (DUF2520 family)